MEKKNVITRINDGFCTVERTVTWVAFAIMLALLLIQVFCRYVFSMPLAWAEELVRYTYVGVSFTGAIVAIRERSHIGIDIVLSLVEKVKNEKVRTTLLDLLDIFANVVQVIFFVVIAIWMYEYNVDIAAKNQITTANEWPMWIMCLPVTVSCVLMAFHSVLNTIESVIDIFVVGKRKGGAVTNG
jgi:TRAP-type C4-dicarboxylate transport system permease small subunit